MARGRGRGAETYINSKGPKKAGAHAKDVRRAAVAGRKQQGLGSGGRSGGTKAAGGHAHSGPCAPACRDHGGMRNGGGGG